jgi:hypothetical protein
VGKWKALKMAWGIGVQFDDVRVSKHPHVFDLPLDPSFRLCCVDDLLRYVLHSNFVPRQRMNRH